MLQHLHIQNYALIDSLDIDFTRGLNILTGETGSGKSILLGALGLILGDRAESQVVKSDGGKCIVEGSFELPGDQLKMLFKKYDIDYENNTILRREVLESGKSRAFINDTPVKLNVLKELGLKLVDIHSQHQTLQINDPEFQIRVFDHFAGCGNLLDAYREPYRNYVKVKQRLEAARDAQAKNLNQVDFIKFQLNEFDELKIEKIDELELETEFNTLSNAEEITERLNAALVSISEGENAAISELQSAQSQLERLASYSANFADLASRISSSLIEIDDIRQELENSANSIEIDPKRLEKLNQLRSSLFRLQQKHGVSNVKGLEEKSEELRESLQKIEGLDEEIETLEKQLAELEKQVMENGKQLSEKRAAYTDKFASEIEKVLHSLNMEKARFEVMLTRSASPGIHGIDLIEMKFSANLGRPPQELKKVASGGELSRLMLAIKKLSASAVTSSIIFDEIDSGVSGEVANAMGRIMKSMASDKQVLCITHLPQIASKGETHFKVYKGIKGGDTITNIAALNEDERVVEIAQMLSGAKTTDAAMDNARDLLQLN
ncbi:MAG TPA: DNA repair protein RecN [Cryomorphaceae bacterium]|nr:DNA repair protein RecN [Cryomorphaceae bacterium]